MGISSGRRSPKILSVSDEVAHTPGIGGIILSMSWVTFLVLGFACFAGYFSTISSGFLADDFPIIHAIMTESFLDIGQGGTFFRPLTWLLFGVNFLLTGESPAAFHLVNLILHVATCLTVAAIAGKLVRHPYAGLIAGLIFALHPIHPEAVVWIAGRFDLLCGMLLALSFNLHLRSVDNSWPKTVNDRRVALLFFSLACLAKEAAFVFPFALLMYESIFREITEPLKKRFLIVTATVGPYFIAAIVLFSFRWLMLGGIGGGPDYVPESTAELLDTGWLYRMFIQPFMLLTFPFNRYVFSLMPLILIIFTCLLLVLPWILIAARPSGRIILFCIAAVIIFSVATSRQGILEASLRNSRFLYIPSIFFSIMFAGIYCHALRKKLIAKFTRISLVVLLVAQIFILTVNNSPWCDAGQMVRSVAASSDQLVEEHLDEWGKEKVRIVVSNLPRTRLGALAFDWGFPEMLIMRHGAKLDGVEIVVFHTGLQTEETMQVILGATSRDDTVSWLFSEKDWVLNEYRPE